MSRAARATAVAAVGALAACAEPTASETEPPLLLVDAQMWTVVEPSRDLFAARRSPDSQCDAAEGWAVELLGPDLAFEVHTDWCDYITVEQSLLGALRDGDSIRVRLWHYELISPEPAEAYLALAIAGTVFWEYTTSIPSPATLVSESVEIADETQEGDEIQFHVDNHGVNAWALIEVTRERGSR